MLALRVKMPPQSSYSQIFIKHPICQPSVFHQLEEQKPSQASQSFGLGAAFVGACKKRTCYVALFHGFFLSITALMPILFES